MGKGRKPGGVPARRGVKEQLLQRGEPVVVNLRPKSDPETEYIAFDGPRILRVLGRIIADLDALAGLPPKPEEESKDEDAEARRVRRRKRLAEPETQPRHLSVREERALLRPLLDRPPYDRDGLPVVDGHFPTLRP
jgi:hypothetical protein